MVSSSRACSGSSPLLWLVLPLTVPSWLLLGWLIVATPAVSESLPAASTSHEAFEQQRAERDKSFPAEPTHAIALDGEGGVLAATDSGLFHSQPGKEFAPLDRNARGPRRTTAVASQGSFLYYAITAHSNTTQTNTTQTDRGSAEDAGHGLLLASGAGGPERRLIDLPSQVYDIAVSAGLPAELFLASKTGLLHFQDGSLSRIPLDEAGSIRKVAVSVGHPYSSNHRMIAVAAEFGLFLFGSQALPDEWIRLAPSTENNLRSWNPIDVRAVAFDSLNRLWFASPQGIGVYDFERSSWTLLTEKEGLPWNEFTTAVADPDGSLWLGTTRGLIHLTLDPSNPQEPAWEVRQGQRWLPSDLIHDIEVADTGTLWIGTDGGLARIDRVETNLQQKADHYETDIHRYHRRTEYGFVDGAFLSKAGDRSTATLRSSDNDGLWTAMYGASQCFAWAATGNEQARKRAQQAFEALRFLSEVTQGGEHAAPPGFAARSIIRHGDTDPNIGLVERDIERTKGHDRKWKIIDPRWPTSADGKWYWKSDTSSDELDGHYFFYALYFDLVADSSQKAAVTKVVTAMTDHLIDHDFAMVDHTGTPTRWAVFGPKALNNNKYWGEERGLNSLSMIAYLRIAEHVSSNPRYGEIAQRLIDDHGYAANIRVPKVQSGPGTGNQSDDEMALMGYYHLLRYEKDPQLKELWAHSLKGYFNHILPERNPLFNYIALSTIGDLTYDDAYETGPLLSDGERVEAGRDALDSLRRFPLDLVDWRLKNSHRLDVLFLEGSDPDAPRGHLRDGKVLPIDERHVGHWNHDPWRLDQGGSEERSGYRMADGASYLLAYYLGLYHDFLAWAPQ